MSEEKKHGLGRTVLSVVLVVVMITAISIVFLRISEQGNRIAVQVAAKSGTIRVANQRGVPGEVEWVCDAIDPSILVLETRDLQNEQWERAVAELLPGCRLQLVKKSTHTMQASTAQKSGKVFRKVQAVRAQLEIVTAEGSIEPALGISASVSPDGGDMTTSYVTILQLIGSDGTPQPIDGLPLFNQKPVTWIERARGMPAHLVRFDLEVIDPEEEVEPIDPEEDPEDAERRAKEAIENLKANRPERGVIPGLPKKPDGS